MTGMQAMYNEGKLNIVQAVGYPSPNFSHFRATDIWMSGSSSDQILTTGWAGRYLNTEYPNYPQGYPNATHARSAGNPDWLSDIAGLAGTWHEHGYEHYQSHQFLQPPE